MHQLSEEGDSVKQSPSALGAYGLGLGPRVAAWIVGILLFALLVVPFVLTIQKSFLQLDASQTAGQRTFIGLANYSALVREEPEFWTSLLGTGWFLLFASLQCVAAFGLACWLRFLWAARLPRTVSALLVIPPLVSPTVVALMGRFYLHDQIGIASRLLRSAGLMSADAAPLASSTGAWIALAVLDAWQWLPFTALLFWLSFRMIPGRHMEAAQMDALGLTSAWMKVYLPRIAAPVAMVLLFRLLEALRVFELPHLLTGGGPGTSTMVASMYASRVTFLHQRFGLGAAHLILLEAAAYLLILILIGRLRVFRGLLRERAS